PYANAEAATSRANIQNTGMAVFALYPGPQRQPSTRCNGVLPGLRGPGTGGQEQRDGEAGGGDQVARAVGLREQAAQRTGQEDAVRQPAGDGARPHQRVLRPDAGPAELGGTPVGGR